MVESSNKEKTEEDAEDVEGLHDMEEEDLLWEWVRSKWAWIKKELGRWTVSYTHLRAHETRRHL
eukprot:3730983-Prorocentrum_lima.AAC.1